MKIKSIEHSFFTTRVNCYSGKCRPGGETIIKERTNIKVDVGNGIVVDVDLSNEEIEYLKQIVFAKVKEKLSTLNVATKNQRTS